MYVDTSILAPYYCPEPLSDRVPQVLAAQRRLAVSWLVEAELASALAQKVRRRQLPAADAGRAAAMFQRHLSQGLFVRLPLAYGHFRQASAWLQTFSLPLRTLDALHWAITAAAGMELLTSDRALAASAARLNLPARLLAAGGA